MSQDKQGDLARNLANKIILLTAERDALREALQEAAQSLRTISEQAGKDEFMKDVYGIRGYANSRANVAEAALSPSDPTPQAQRKQRRTL